jgi:predicted amidohydrolase
MFRIGFFQFDPKFGEVEMNLATVLSALQNVDADLIVLPELAFTGYYFQNRRELMSMSEDPETSRTVDGLTHLCRERDFFLVTGFAERNADKIFNSALLIGPHGLSSIYRKLHLFNTEKEYFDPGDTPLATIDVRGAKIGMMVCFDWVFPEVARMLSLKGADILCHPSNLVLDWCQQAMVTRCLENAVFAVTANRIGADVRPQGELKFTGKSQVTAPKGKIVYRAAPDKKELYIAEIDLSFARNKFMTQKNDVFRDRRPEFYTSLSQKFQSR